MKKVKRILFIVSCVLLSLAIPVFFQPSLNLLFRAVFNPEGSIILKPVYRVLSTIVCMCLTYYVTRILLEKAKASKFLRILHIVCCILWTMFIAMGYYLVAIEG